KYSAYIKLYYSPGCADRFYLLANGIQLSQIKLRDSEEHKFPTIIPVIDDLMMPLQKPRDIRLPNGMVDFIEQAFE
ncbi:unnamed protein product, partial [Didymodactylos carnosus]